MMIRLGCLAASGFSALCIALSTTAATAAGYQFTAIAVPGSTNDYALSVNDNDTVVGYSDSGTVSSGTRTGYVLRKGVVTELPASYGYTALTNINDRGIAVGYQAPGGYNPTNGLYYDIRTNTLSQLDFNYDHQKTNLSSPGTISQSRMIVGVARSTSQAYSTAFLIGPGSTTVLEAPHATPGSTAPAIVNKTGMVAGTYTGPQGETNTFTYSEGTYARVNPPGAFETYVSALSDAGVVGGSYSDSHRTTALHGFTWNGTSYRTFDFPGSSSTTVSAFGANGEVFGVYKDASGASHGFGLIGANYFTLDYPGGSSTVVTSANAVGTVAGFFSMSGVSHSFLATCPLRQRPCTQ